MRWGWIGIGVAALLAADALADDAALGAAQQALEAGRFTEAASAFAALTEADPSGEAHLGEAIARYEAGDLRGAERASHAGLQRISDHAGLLNLYGLVLADLGRGREAVGVLERARDAAEGGDDPVLLARVLLNRGLVEADAGRLAAARSAYETARREAEAAGAVGLAEQASLQILHLERAGGADRVGRVAGALAAGRLDEARAALTPPDAGRRDRARAEIAQGLVARAEGRLDAAADHLRAAHRLAEEGALLRESAVARLELARVHRLAGAVGTARDVLLGVRASLEGTSFRLRHADAEVALGRLLVQVGDLDGAADALARARRLVGAMEHPAAKVQLEELQGDVAAARGADAEADAARARAETGWAGLDRAADAARVAAARVRAAAQTGHALRARRDGALARFEAAGDALGPAHVALAEGLGLAAGDDVEGALRAFAQAHAVARQVGGPRGERLAGVAEADIAEALVVLGHDAEALSVAEELGVGAAIERHAIWTEARARYAAGRSAYDAGQYDAAAEAFVGARAAFERLGEASSARATRRALAWARWNQLVEAPAARIAADMPGLVAEGEAVDDEELAIRASVAGAVAAAELGRPGARARLDAAADRADAGALPALAARCHAAAADLPGTLGDRAAAARRAAARAPGPDAAWALYSVAVDAYQADDLALARALAEEALPFAGKLEGDLREIVDAIDAAG